YAEERFDESVAQFEEVASKLLIQDIRFFPISALYGDNVVNQSENMKWYDGAPLLHALETVYISSDINKVDARFPVQTVLRPQNDEHRDYRGYAGRIASGSYHVGDKVSVLPSGFKSKIKSINAGEKEVDMAYAPMSISMTLEDDIDVSRGDMIVRENNQHEQSQEFDVMLCWMNDKSTQSRAK